MGGRGEGSRGCNCPRDRITWTPAAALCNTRLMSTEMDEPPHPGSGLTTEYEEAVKPTTDPVQLLPYVADALRDALEEHYFTDPKLFELDEVELEKLIRKNQQELNTRDDAMRARFWYCYDIAAYNMKKMSLTDLCAGIMQPSIFYASYIKNRFRIAWMVCKPTTLEIQDIAAISVGKRKMAEILRMDALIPGTTKIDYKLVSLQIAIYKNLENRVFGMPTQKIVQKNINTEVSNVEMQKQLETQDATHLRDKLQDLKTLSLKSLPITPDSSSGKLPDVEIKKNE